MNDHEQIYYMLTKLLILLLLQFHIILLTIPFLYTYNTQTQQRYYKFISFLPCVSY